MKKETGFIPLEISSQHLMLLKKESDKVWNACTSLDNQQAFNSAVLPLTKREFQNIEYKAAHILYNDVVSIFNDFAVVCGEYSKIPTRAKFILIFLYEKLQGKDISTLYDLKKINELPLSTQFDKNIHIIRETSFFEEIDEMKSEMIIPAILTKIKSEHTIAISLFLTRIASLLIKSDDRVSKKEEILLKKISDKVLHPKVIVAEAKYTEVAETDSLEIVMAELAELVGLEEVKKSVEDLTNFLKVQKIREEKGLKTSSNSLHAVFMGPPGTGKTTVARMLGRIYKHLGYLEKGHLVETDRSGMVAGYVGQTAIKADEIIKAAIGGVLFIDEAYALTSGGLNDYGSEAIEILLKRMEDQRDNLVVVVAGYPDEMEEFIQSNPGLQSRFNRYFGFDHFSAEALLKIFKLIAAKGDFVLTKDAEEKLNAIIERLHEKRFKGFGNARVMRNLFEKIIERQANRIVSIAPLTEDILITLVEDDIPEILKTVKEIIPFEG
ncbi:AAA family ATPase [Aquimarina sp. 2-A2]|uniref:AAA family ATPase n=1 Tax=Aquimarina sp. 2-A2 TaxID=3382644 RepID=UPI00387F0738